MAEKQNIIFGPNQNENEDYIFGRNWNVKRKKAAGQWFDWICLLKLSDTTFGTLDITIYIPSRYRQLVDEIIIIVKNIAEKW